VLGELETGEKREKMDKEAMQLKGSWSRGRSKGKGGLYSFSERTHLKWKVFFWSKTKIKGHDDNI